MFFIKYFFENLNLWHHGCMNFPCMRVLLHYGIAKYKISTLPPPLVTWDEVTSGQCRIFTKQSSDEQEGGGNIIGETMWLITVIQLASASVWWRRSIDKIWPPSFVHFQPRWCSTVSETRTLNRLGSAESFAFVLISALEDDSISVWESVNPPPLPPSSILRPPSSMLHSAWPSVC